jgi:GalNAc-alpha-(1->4)-GalNAc-alpha-(1->3)-diNAcBac-PP-undecaprenol alpha-1,4-N-acetyl-D-galactosaminyltransferase
MKLLLVIDGLGSGGAQRQLATLACAMVARGHQVEMFTYFDERHFVDIVVRSGVRLHLHPKTSRYSIAPLRALRRLVVNGGFDCVLAFLRTPAIYAELACLVARGTRLIVSERSFYGPQNLGWSGRLREQMHRCADWITVNSFHQQATMVGLFPWMLPRISTIWNGLDVDHFGQQPLPPPKPGRLGVQVLASIARNKNPLGLANAVAICRDRHGLRVEVDWAGVSTISGQSDAEKMVTDDFLRAQRLEHQWIWSGEVRDVRPLFEKCDVAVHPSLGEGLPNAVCEALSCGRAVLAGDVGDHRRLLADEANGFLFDPRDPEEIADALFKYSLLGAEQRARMAGSARRFAESQLSLTRFASAYEELFRKLAVEGSQ